MIENGGTGEHLSAKERMVVIKSILQQVIDIVTNADDDESIETAHRLLEEFVLHVEAGGPELALNYDAKMLLDVIKNRSNLSSRNLAKHCAQMLGVLDIDECNDKESEKDNTLLSKHIFLKILNDKLDKVLIKRGSLKTMYDLERHLGRMLFSEKAKNAPDEVRELCGHIEECIADALDTNYRLDHSRILIQRRITAIFQGNKDKTFS